MLNRIENLKQKSERERKRAALLASSGIMVVIVGIWLVTFPTQFPDLMPSSQAQAAAELNAPQATADANASNSAASPLEALREGLNGNYVNDSSSGEATSTTEVQPANSDVVSNGVVITDPDLETNDQLHIVK